MPHAATRLLALGDSAWTVEFGSNIDPKINARVMALADRVAQARRDEPLFGTVTDVVPTFRSLTVSLRLQLQSKFLSTYRIQPTPLLRWRAALLSTSWSQFRVSHFGVDSTSCVVPT